MRGLILTLSLMMLACFPAQANTLNQSQSPYLQLHANDPVQWRIWSDAAFDEAHASNRPVLLSIGYMACHWCHVMQAESYTNKVIADYINTHFIPILVDRESQPAIDATYQHAVANFGAPTGWPLTVFLTPDRAPFWGGGYFPQPARGGMPSFLDILNATKRAYQEDPSAVQRSAVRAIDQLHTLANTVPGKMTMSKVYNAGQILASQLDPLQGGFGHGAKFPNIPALHLIWKTAIATENKTLKEIVLENLHLMVHSTLFDHVGGGFFRYTIDPAWRVPHFEKMLDVQAQWITLLTDIWLETQDPDIKQRLDQTVHFVRRHMHHPKGGFISALDADSPNARGHMEEGAYYTWTAEQLQQILGADLPDFSKRFAVAVPESGLADGPGAIYALDVFAKDATQLLEPLRKAQQNRRAPAKDNKIIVTWNADVIRALARYHSATQPDQSMPNDIFQTYQMLRDRLINAPGGPYRILYQDKPGPAAILDDLAAMAQVALDLYQMTFDQAYLKDAQAFVQQTTDFLDQAQSGYYITPPSNELPVPFKPRFDEPNPSANARMIAVLATLALLTGQTSYADLSVKTLNAFGGLSDDPHNFRPGAALFGSAFLTYDAVQSVIIAKPNNSNAKKLLETVHKVSLPARTLLRIRPGMDLPLGHPARYKEMVDGLPTAYVCRGTICSLPVTDPVALQSVLISMRGPSFAPSPTQITD